MQVSIVDDVAVIFIRVRAETRYLNCRCIDEEHISSFKNIPSDTPSKLIIELYPIISYYYLRLLSARGYSMSSYSRLMCVSASRQVF
jgi:hypothetical protein